MFYHLKTPLFEGEPDANGGGGNPTPEPVDFKALLGEFQKSIIGELDKRVNGINKEFKAQTKALSTGFDSFKTEITASLKPREEPPVNDEEEEEAARLAAEAAAANEPPNPVPGRPGERRPKQDPPKTPKPSPHEQRLQRELDAMRAKQEELQKAAEKREKEAEAKEVTGILKEAISKQPFNNDRGAGDLFALLRPNLVRGEDGNLYGPEGLTVDEYVSNEYSARPFLHPAKNVNGSGAGPNSPNLNSKSSFDLDNIRPGMSAEETAAAMSAIAAAMNR